MRKIYLLLLSLILLPYGMRAQEEAYPSTVTVSFSQNGQAVTSVPYGSTVTITATMEKAETVTNALSASAGTVDFYLGAVENGTKLNQTGVSVTQGPDGTCTATLEVTLAGEEWKPNESPYIITAVFGGYAPDGDESGDSLAPNTGSAELTVTKAEQSKPTGTFSLISSTENSLSVNFFFSDQPANENRVEIAYAEGPTADAPTSNWTTAEKIPNSTVYSATIDQLSPGTPYVFFARYKEGEYHKPSPPIVSDFAPHTKPKINTTSLPNAYVGVEYSQKLEAEAAEGVAVSWAIYSGSLPAGLTLNGDGTITGTPTAPTTQAVNFTVNATIGEGASSVFSTQTLTISVAKSDAELGGLTVTGNTGINEGAFQYGDIITVTFTPQPRVTTSTKSLEENTATLTYTNAEGPAVELATATAQSDGSFELSYDTKEKKLPIGENLPLTVSYGGSGALNPVEKELTVTLEQAILKNMPTVTGSFVYGETLTVNYTKQDDESVTYQWYRGGEKISDATENSYTLTAEDISKNIYVIVSATDEWHRGAMQSRQQEVAKAPLNEDDIKITQSAPIIELGSEGVILTATITSIEDVNKAENWIWTSSNDKVAEVIRLTPEADALNTATKTYDITVKAKEEEPTPKPDPTPIYYNIQFEDICEGVDASLSKGVVKEGNQVSVYVEVEEGYDDENLKVLFKRSLYGYWEEVEEGVQPGEYIIYNVYNDIYVKVEGVEKIEEEPTGMSDIESTKVYTQNGSLYVYTSQSQEVMIITMNGTVLRRERQEGLRSYSLPRGVYIICIGEEKFKLRI